MVFATSARDDLKTVLTKTIIYRYYPNITNDLASEDADNTLIQKYYDYNIRAQCTLNNFNTRRTTDGTVIEGDLVGLFDYKYIVDADGKAINPDLVPKTRDRVYFLGQWYVIKDCTPATSEDDEIIGWDFVGVQVTNTKNFNLGEEW